MAFSPLREKCSVFASMLWSQHRFKGGCFPLLISALPKRETGSHTCLPPHVHCTYRCPTALFFFLSSTSHNVRQVQRASASITFLKKTPCWYSPESQKSSFPFTPQQSVNALWFPSHGGSGQSPQDRTRLLLRYLPSLIRGKTVLFMWFVLSSPSCVRSLEDQFGLLALPRLPVGMWGISLSYPDLTIFTLRVMDLKIFFLQFSCLLPTPTHWLVTLWITVLDGFQ